VIRRASLCRGVALTLTLTPTRSFAPTLSPTPNQAHLSPTPNQAHFSLESAWWLHNLVANLAYARWTAHADVSAEIIEVEVEAFGAAALLEARALALLRQGHEVEAAQLLTDHTVRVGQALLAPALPLTPTLALPLPLNHRTRCVWARPWWRGGTRYGCAWSSSTATASSSGRTHPSPTATSHRPSHRRSAAPGPGTLPLPPTPTTTPYPLTLPATPTRYPYPYPLYPSPGRLPRGLVRVHRP
jgi:hypothetical protein